MLHPSPEDSLLWLVITGTGSSKLKKALSDNDNGYFSNWYHPFRSFMHFSCGPTLVVSIIENMPFELFIFFEVMVVEVSLLRFKTHCSGLKSHLLNIMTQTHWIIYNL